MLSRISSPPAFLNAAMLDVLYITKMRNPRRRQRPWWKRLAGQAVPFKNGTCPTRAPASGVPHGSNAVLLRSLCHVPGTVKKKKPAKRQIRAGWAKKSHKTIRH